MNELINELISNYGLIAIFILMLTNGVISAPPSELTLSFAGIFVGITNLTLVITIPVAILGNLIGTSILYFIGYKVGYKWVINLDNRHTDKQYNFFSKLYKSIIPDKIVVDYLIKTFQKKGAVWVGILRCLPMIRSIISLPAGIIRMPSIIFYVYTTLGISIWTIIWQLIGFYIGNSWMAYDLWITISTIVIFILIIVILKYYLNRMMKKIKAGNTIGL